MRLVSQVMKVIDLLNQFYLSIVFLMIIHLLPWKTTLRKPDLDCEVGVLDHGTGQLVVTGCVVMTQDPRYTDIRSNKQNVSCHTFKDLKIKSLYSYVQQFIAC